MIEEIDLSKHKTYMGRTLYLYAYRKEKKYVINIRIKDSDRLNEMKKLYTIKKVVETCFVADDGLDPDAVYRAGLNFLKEEESWGENHISDPVEITELEQLDESWHICLPWGLKEDITIKNFFRLQKLKAFE